jgi:hypothetical protein
MGQLIARKDIGPQKPVTKLLGDVKYYLIHTHLNCVIAVLENLKYIMKS